MSERGFEFASDWVVANNKAINFKGENDPLLEVKTAEFIAAAKKEGIALSEIEDEVGPIGEYILEAIQDASE